MTTLKIYKTHPEVFLPKFATEQAACFDIVAQFHGKIGYVGYSEKNFQFERHFANYNNSIVVMPGERIAVPTGLIFDIPEGYSIRIHPRSGLSYMRGLVLANLEGIIDSDYYHETMVLIHNTSALKEVINNGDRIAQAELVKSEKYKIEETKEKPKQRTDRVGGLGSTGVSANVKV
jgi:dUTP pyrophosphatase